MSIRNMEPVASKACRECGGTGTLWDFDVDGGKVRIPCPGCQRPNRYEQARAELAREYGTDAQRHRIAARSVR